MKTRILLFGFIVLLATCLFLGNASGPGAVQMADRTGGPIADGYCTNCHGGGNFGTEVAITLLSGNDTVTEYEPGAAYTLRVDVVAQGAEGYGFQMVALDTSNAGTGAFGTPPSGIQITTLGEIDYAEHSARSNTPTFEIEWTAPEVGSGPISFYAAGNAVNGNFAIDGDEPDTSSLTIAEGSSSGLFDIAAEFELQLAPNPATDLVNVRWSTDHFKPERILLVNVMGQRIIDQKLIHNQNAVDLYVSDYPFGVYFVQLRSPEGLQTRRLLKN